MVEDFFFFLVRRAPPDRTSNIDAITDQYELRGSTQDIADPNKSNSINRDLLWFWGARKKFTDKQVSQQRHFIAISIENTFLISSLTTACHSVILNRTKLF